MKEVKYWVAEDGTKFEDEIKRLQNLRNKLIKEVNKND